MMLTAMEKLKQTQLKRAGAELFDVAYVTLEEDGQQLIHESQVYAETLEDAEELAAMIQIRANRKAQSNSNIADTLTLNAGEMRNHKLGLLLPWKDPLYARSFKAATSLPFRRAVGMIQTLRKYIKSPNVINKSDLSEEQINKLLSATIRTVFTTAILFVLALVLVIKGIVSDSGYQYFYSAAFLLIYCTSVGLQVRNTRTKLFKWKNNHE